VWDESRVEVGGDGGGGSPAVSRNQRRRSGREGMGCGWVLANDTMLEGKNDCSIRLVKKEYTYIGKRMTPLDKGPTCLTQETHGLTLQKLSNIILGIF
jgi:hypothetical protein